MYELIVRHFLACCSKDAQGQEVTVEIDIAEEKFSASGLTIIARNYLDVYPYDKWYNKVMFPVGLLRITKIDIMLNQRDVFLLITQVIPLYTPETTFQPTAVEMVEGQTSPPQLLTEADLISLMEKHGIGIL